MIPSAHLTKPYEELTRAERVIAFIEVFCKVPEGKHVGQSIHLDDFQKKFIYDVYDNEVHTSLAILSMARKNGKTSLIAALILVHLVGPEAIQNSQIISGAMSREQASLVFKLACKMIKQNPALDSIIHIVYSNSRLQGLKKGTEYFAIASEASTAFGLSPVVAILDELGQIRGPASPFIESITTAQGAYDNARVFVISTQAPTDADLLSVWIDDARKSKDKSTVCHVYEAPEELDILDKKAWKLANPALGTFRSLEDVRRQAEKASRMPTSEAAFRNLILNQRVAQQAALFSPGIWKANNGVPQEEAFTLYPVYAGLDLSARLDLTALALVAEDEDGVWHSKMMFWSPNSTLNDRADTDRAPYPMWRDQGFLRALPGVSLDYSVIAREIYDIVKEMDLQQLAVDRWRLDSFIKEVEVLGVSLPIVPWGQGYKDMSPALEAFEHVVFEHRLRHGDHPILTFCVSNATVVRDPAGNRKLDKSKETGRIDGAQAMAMAFGVAARFNAFVDVEAMIA